MCVAPDVLVELVELEGWGPSVATRVILVALRVVQKHKRSRGCREARVWRASDRDRGRTGEAWTGGVARLGRR